MECVIKVNRAVKQFKTYENGTGFLGFFGRKFYYKKALKGVSFTISRGEIVALLGRNGSGKSTMIKMLAGILHPDSGSIRVLGMDPWKDRITLAMKIGIVFGATHPQLLWNLPPEDTFEYIKGLYNVSDSDYKSRLDALIEMLGIRKVYKRQTRQLSLGERMKCEFVAAMLHMPDIVYMDEPTIGVDLPSRIAISKAVLDLRERFKTTFIMTTHVVDDISNSDRIILLDHGKKLFDGPQETLRKRFGKVAILELYFNGGVKNPNKAYESLGKVLESKYGYMRIEVKPEITKSKGFYSIFANKDIKDYRLSEPGLSSILESTYKSIDATGEDD